MSQFGRLDEVFSSSLYQQFTHTLFTKSEIMSREVLGRYLDEFAIPGLLLTFLYVLASKIITATGLIGTGLAILELKHISTKIQPVVKMIMITIGSIALISMGLIIIKVFVLSSRYVVSLAWILLIFASFYLTSLSLSSSKKVRIIFIVICIILGLCFIKNILPKREGYNYMQNAVTWLKIKNTTNTSVFYDDTRMIYYSKSPFIGKWSNSWQTTLSAIEKGTIKNYDFLLVSHSKKHSSQLNIIKENLPEYLEINRFNNYKAKKFIVIYARKKQTVENHKLDN